MTRKQVYDLLPQDLEEFPVWEYATDEEGEEGQDEATVRPVPGEMTLDSQGANCIVAARLTLSDGTTWCGYLTSDSEGERDLGSVQPVIVTPNGQVAFWCGTIAPDKEHLTKCYALLGKSPSEVFPLNYISSIDLPGGPVTGTVSGFIVLTDWRSGTTKVVR